MLWLRGFVTIVFTIVLVIPLPFMVDRTGYNELETMAVMGVIMVKNQVRTGGKHPLRSKVQTGVFFLGAVS